MNDPRKFPLEWPSAIARMPLDKRTHAQFKRWTRDAAKRRLVAEIDRLNELERGYTLKAKIIISTNLKVRADGEMDLSQAEPADTGVAVYFPLDYKQGGQVVERKLVMTCDKWNMVAWNIYAIAMDLEAQRARTRWGCTNYGQAFKGYLLLPERASGKPWWEVLGLPATGVTQDQVEAAFRLLAKKHHPDHGGDIEKWHEFQLAYDQALAATA